MDLGPFSFIVTMKVLQENHQKNTYFYICSTRTHSNQEAKVDKRKFCDKRNNYKSLLF